ncbi:hypothetical protein CCR85_02870 [Rhodothalassium salexigens]|uniref:acyl-CoA dehydrogenase family protein n=1 Tax=Rhodothalassium salexigens TaxID=1086 RepID=UPI00191314DC|nr:acyl-CoA dehydrogenase family protein [Rhodothalassium salexigens]MBK5910433.1 hypothetical protein [Rhodothalassium salexigens]MBK5921749.1 hypothetical protein [Rhodothalassium salexigens]
MALATDVTRPDPLAAAKALQPAIRERAEAIEAERRLPADLAADLARAGLTRLFVPAAAGGLEMDPPRAFAATEALARADASVAWCQMIAATTGLLAAYLPSDRAARIFAAADAITGGVFAPKGEARPVAGGYRVSGRWQWASGSANCTWLMGGCRVVEDGAVRTLPNGAPDVLMALVPREAVTLYDTWHTAGLAGTGSGDMAIVDAEVPGAHTASFFSDRPVADGPLYRFPVFAMLAQGIAATALGNARGALDELAAFGTAKTRQFERKALGATPHVQGETARAEALLSSARAFWAATLADAWDRASAGQALSVETRARLRLAATHATRTAAEVTAIAHDLAGGAAAFLSFPIQRRFRDAHVATQHIMVGHATYETYGRTVYGLDVDATFV